MIGNPVTPVTRGVTCWSHWKVIEFVHGFRPVTPVTRINPKRVEQRNDRATAEAGGIGNMLWTLHREIWVTRVTRVTRARLWAFFRAFGKPDRVNYRVFPGMGPSPASGLRGARSLDICPATEKIEIPKFGFPLGIPFTLPQDLTHDPRP